MLHAGSSECRFNLLARNSNDNSYIFLYYMPEVPNVGFIEERSLQRKIIDLQPL
ncbi:MAG: hypothetical protein O4965_30960 [Trichodesmium sp. St19_bin1]|nr:hypothetical protein [Trichodesmium sp. St19_bin1]